MAIRRADYEADSPPSVLKLEIKPHFEALSDKEKRYAHYISRASFFGTRITLREVSYESEPLYDFIVELYKSCEGDWAKLRTDSKIEESVLRNFLNFACQFLGNSGNYKGFGDSKFVPSITAHDLDALANRSLKATELRKQLGDSLFIDETKPELLHLGYPDAGHLSTYYPDSPTITKAEIEAVGEFLEKKKLLVENSRLRKTTNGDFETLIASAITSPPPQNDIGSSIEFPLEGSLEGKTLRLVFGDHSAELTKVVEALHSAKENAANDEQVHLLESYIRHFDTGSMEAFKESQRWWIRDKGPMVESNIGFIETYRDPHGVRGEWEGFAAMVNQERTRAFGKLVESAESMIPKLPWGQEFEKDKFLSPDFTSLEVLSFQGSGIPAGINIPNMDDIRQQEGFKNVSLGNVISASSPDEKIPFIIDSDQELYSKYLQRSFEVQVGIHELLGHGTGKLLQETTPETYNFDIRNPPISPVTKEPIKTWYKPGQTWGSVFGSFAASYEECRAECVAMVLGCDFEILKIFGAGDGTEDINGEAGDVLYIAYLSMARAGLAALQFWDPKSKKWGQAHMQARYSILKCFMDAGQGFATLSHTPGQKGDVSGLTVSVDRSKILDVGRPAVASYLQKLHIYKSCADYDAGKDLYDTMTHVDEWWGKEAREEVLLQKKPRKVFVQANTFVDENGKVSLVEYEPTVEGMIKSWAERNV
ncbi:MAG: hypothetical protein M1814_001256 [Vezdaea aestivalis]|nr:MAG: hypothetical protein M1814_001256 [Vezdaea aestivalis]